MMETLAKKLFDALDDTVLAQYYDYKEHGGERPSKMSVDALVSAETYFGPSKVLSKILDEFLKDLVKEST